jgi:ribosomal-protein-alanine N-acetyltransferase
VSGAAQPCSVERVQSDDDLSEVLAIERASFTNPWTWDMFRGEIQNGPVSQIFVLRCEDRRVRAFCSVWLVEDELHVNNVAVDPEFRRQGLARALLAHVFSEAARRGAVRATLEVRRSNAAALRLYEEMGFVVAGVRRDYYVEPVEDALILWKTGLFERETGVNPTA